MEGPSTPYSIETPCLARDWVAEVRTDIASTGGAGWRTVCKPSILGSRRTPKVFVHVLPPALQGSMDAAHTAKAGIF